jgi:hypothetical protein
VKPFGFGWFLISSSGRVAPMTATCPRCACTHSRRSRRRFGERLFPFVAFRCIFCGHRFLSAGGGFTLSCTMVSAMTWVGLIALMVVALWANGPLRKRIGPGWAEDSTRTDRPLAGSNPQETKPKISGENWDAWDSGVRLKGQFDGRIAPTPHTLSPSQVRDVERMLVDHPFFEPEGK